MTLTVNKLILIVVSIREQRSFVSQTLGSVVDIGFKERASIVTSLLSETTGNTLNRNTLLVFQRLIISRADTGTSISEEFLIALANVINYLCEALLQPLPFQVSVLSLQVVNSILQKYVSIPSYEVEMAMIMGRVLTPNSHAS